MSYILFGVGKADAFDAQGNKVYSARAILENTVNISASEVEVRGGDGNALQGVCYHTSKVDVTVKDALFDMQYLATKVGAAINVGGDVLKTETVTVGTAGAITVTGTPKEIFGGVYGWYGDNKRLTFTGKTGKVEGYNQNDIITVQYNELSDSARVIEVAQNFVPDTVCLYIRGGLYNGDPANVQSASKIGECITKIPKFKSTANATLTMSATGASESDLSGFALITVDEKHPNGYYCTITEHIDGRTWTDGLVGLAFKSVDTIAKGSTLEVYAVYSGGKVAPKLLDNSKLLFTGADTSGVVTATTGVVTAKIKDATGDLAKVIASYTIV